MSWPLLADKRTIIVIYLEKPYSHWLVVRAPTHLFWCSCLAELYHLQELSCHEQYNSAWCLMKFIWRVINQEGEDHILTYLCLIFLHGGGGHWRNASEIIQASLESKWPDRAVWPGILRRRESRRCGGSPIGKNDLDGWQHHCWWSLIMWHPDKELDVVGCHCCCRLLNGASKQTTANIVCRCLSYQSVHSLFVYLQDAPL